MRSGLDGPRAMDMLRVMIDLTLGAGVTISSALTMAGTIVSEAADAMSEAVAPSSMPRRLVVDPSNSGVASLRVACSKWCCS